MRGPKKHKALHSASLNELVYSVLYHATPEEKSRLKGRFRQAVKSQQSAKNFAEKSSMDDKRILLSEMGVQNFIVFVNRPEPGLKSIDEILARIEEEKPKSAAKAAASMELYVTSDKQQIHLLGLMAQAIDHPSYLVELEFNRIGYHLRRWTRSTKQNPEAEILTETIENADLLSKTLLSANLVSDDALHLFKISRLQLNLLLYFYRLRHTFTEFVKVKEYFNLPHVRNFRNELMKLEVNHYILCHAKALPVKKYSITAKGINVVNDYFQQIFKANTF